MITLIELLGDERYKKYFLTVPKLTPIPGKQPWRLFIQRDAEGPWAKKEYERYADAFQRLSKELRGGTLHDGAIQSRGIAFGPPDRVAKVTKGGRPVMVKGSNGQVAQKTIVVEWKPRLGPTDESHIWCCYCRRPVVFRWYRSHHALRGSSTEGMDDITQRRCSICGVREDFNRTVAKSARPPGFNPATAYGTRRTRR